VYVGTEVAVDVRVIVHVCERVETNEVDVVKVQECVNVWVRVDVSVCVKVGDLDWRLVSVHERVDVEVGVRVCVAVGVNDGVRDDVGVEVEVGI
jgi:hypothetical protein